MSSPLTGDAIASLLAKDAAKKASGGGKGGGTRKKKDATEPREYPTWWKLHQSLGTCENPECCDPREGGGNNGTAMVSEVNDKRVCRYCFLDGYNRTEHVDAG